MAGLGLGLGISSGVNGPGHDAGGVTDAWDGILKYQLDINHKPCNFVELFPRLKVK